MGRPAQRKVNREDVYDEVFKAIQQSPNKEAEISVSDLANRFGVQGPSMDYHLNVLVEKGDLILSDRRGKYNKKIYKLPESNISNQPNQNEQIDIQVPFASEDAKSKFDAFIKNHLKESDQTKTNENDNSPNDTEIKTNNNDISDDIVKKDIDDKLADENPGEYIRQVFSPEEVIEEKIEEVNQVNNPEVIIDSNKTNIEVKQLTLDEKIARFLNQTNQVHDAQELLSHQDKEILSVMNETIQQNMVYLKDLSEQLTTIDNKQLIQHLIDERNRLNKEIGRLQQELDTTRKHSQQTKEKFELDPNRIRFMQQIVFDTLDNYVNQPNHALALGRINFRNKLTKEINDLVKYVLHLEK